MYENILLPTDGSETAEQATTHALELADRFDATLHGVFVVDKNLSNQLVQYSEGRFGEDLREEIREEAAEHGEEYTSRLADQADGRGVNVETEVVIADSPHEGIIEYADENDVDLVVMGTHGRSGVSRYVLGSVAEHVVKDSDFPTLLVRNPE